MDLLSFLDAEMLLVQLLWREIMCNNLSFLSPCCIHLLDGQMITPGEQSADIAGWTIRVNVSLFNKKLVYGFAIAKNDDIGWSDFQAEDGAIFLCPYAESVNCELVDSSEIRLLYCS
jgi:hypothetical protein